MCGNLFARKHGRSIKSGSKKLKSFFHKHTYTQSTYIYLYSYIRIWKERMASDNHLPRNMAQQPPDCNTLHYVLASERVRFTIGKWHPLDNATLQLPGNCLSSFWEAPQNAGCMTRNKL